MAGGRLRVVVAGGRLRVTVSASAPDQPPPVDDEPADEDEVEGDVEVEDDDPEADDPEDDDPAESAVPEGFDELSVVLDEVSPDADAAALLDDFDEPLRLSVL